MNKQEFDELAAKIENGTASKAELGLYNAWFNAYADELVWKENELGPLQGRKDRLFDNIQAEIKKQKSTKVIPLYYKIAVAASFALFAIGSAYYFLHEEKTVQVAQIKHDVAPFSKLAVLKTGHGKTIILDNIDKGMLAQYGNTHIQKTTADQIAYTNNESADNKVIFDTLQVPAGGKPYHLKLADGSAVIVNVASTLRYPENFRKGNSEIELIGGEAYFTIVHNPNSPVTIIAPHQYITDIGTEFNVNAYGDEPSYFTTLVEGAIKVNQKTLIPGQQAVITINNLTVETANILRVTAWKDGYFRFNGEKIQAVMRELARWYNIEVKYEGKVADVGYYVKISRSKNISEVLKALERTNSVHFKIEGRGITVLSKK